METSVGLVHVFVILHMMGCFAFVLMVFSALAFPKVKRHPIWYNFCLAWVVFSLSYALLSFGGQQFSTPSRSLCITQAALVYAAPFLSGCASLALVGQLLFKILSALSYVTAPQTYTIYNVAAIGFPWIAWISTLLGIILHVRNDDSRVALSPNATFCVVLRSPIPRLTAVSSVVFSVAMLCLEGAIICMLYRNRAIKDILNQSNAMAFRVTIYTGAAVIATGYIAASTFKIQERTIDILLLRYRAATAFAATNQRGAVFDVIVALSTC
ncbi:hypothetical protein FA15DRAFT_590696 [Coprinopsis marcescibilis]|uniref:G-protein coupled receptors family 2 profile 2 domain-containing protein n=1 Tax=Coprinopsis marcescibilis TaxID=230819 RepID=A0A5C3KYE6_COPMA|nr:hypothetical protein FA15DRAFT_590696 [Coprinopsis marcescibilis]